MNGLDRVAREMARLAAEAMGEVMDRLWPLPQPATPLLDDLTAAEERDEVLEPRHHTIGAPLLPWETEPDPPTGAAGPTPPDPADAGTGGRHHAELTAVLTVILRRHLSKHLGITGAITPVIAKAAATELLHHFTLERRQP